MLTTRTIKYVGINLRASMLDLQECCQGRGTKPERNRSISSSWTKGLTIMKMSIFPQMVM